MTLTLRPLAIGSLPYTDADEALDYVFKLFKNTPFWPQLGNVNAKEDMISQYTQNIPGIIYDKDNNKYYFDTESENFFIELEQFYNDYEDILNGKEIHLPKYAITSPYSSSFNGFCSRIQSTSPLFVKGHITGPFTWGASLCDSEGRCGFFDDTLRDILTKGITLKALWQISQFKKFSPKSKIIIFIDEPAICQYGTSAFVTVQRNQIIESLCEVINTIKSMGALVGIHCCGKADWEMIIDTGIDILNLDAYLYAQNLALYPKKVENFLLNGGYIAWGIVPTLDKDALQKITIEKSEQIFENSVSILTGKGIGRKLILKQSIVTPSCGAGSLNIELAQKAMELTVKLSGKLKEKYLQELI